MKNLFTNLMKNTAKSFQNTGGGASHEKNSAVAVWNDSRTTVDRRSTDGQSQRQYSLSLWKYAAMLLMVLCLGTGEMWGENGSTYTTSFEETPSIWKKGGGSAGVNGVEPRTGTKVGWHIPGTASSEKRVELNEYTISFAKNEYIHLIFYARTRASITGFQYAAYLGSEVGKVNASSDLPNSSWKRYSTKGTYTSAKTAGRAYFYSTVPNKTDTVYYDDVIIYVTSANVNTDLKAPNRPGSPAATTSSITWTRSTDLPASADSTGVKGTLVWRRTSGSSDDLTLNDQGMYSHTSSIRGPSTDQSGHWTLVDSLGAATTSKAGTFSAGDRYAIVHYDLAYNYSTPTYVTVAGGGGGGATTYDVTIADLSNGSITASPTSQEEGEDVTLTVSPSTGYELSGDISVTGDESDDNITATDNGDGTWTFEMPGGDVTVNATFSQIDYTVSKTLTNCAVKAGSSVIPSTMHYGDDLSTIIEPTTGNLLPGSITVSGVTSYTWNALTGALTLTDVTGNVSISISAAAPQTGSGTVTYTMVTSGETEATYSTGVFTGILSGGTANKNTLVASNTLSGGNGVAVQSDKKTPKSSRTAGITSSTDDFSAGSSPYAEFTFDVVDGYTFTPTAISVPVLAITNNAYFTAIVTDGSSTWTSATSECTQGAQATINATPSGGSALTGTVHIRVFCHNQATAAKGFRFGTGSVTITGTVAVEEVCETVPTVAAASNSAVAATTATVTCADGISALGDCDISSYGFVLGTSANPTISNTKHQVGTSYTTKYVSFSKDLTGLTAGTTYYVRPYATNGAGTSYGTQTSFTTSADVTAPTLSSSTPADDATDVATSGNIVLTFSENVTIANASNFTLTGGAGTLNTASASASGTAVTIPYSGLANSTTYTLSTAAGAVQDAASNTSAALSDISFTTAAAPIYYYKDATRYVSSTYKNPEGNAPANTTDETIDLTTPWTICSTCKAGVTSIVANGCKWDNKSGTDYKWISAYIKVPKDGDKSTKNITITLASGYTGTLSVKIGGYSSNPTVTLQPLVDAALGSAISMTTGYATVGGVATTENNFNELRWPLATAGGTYVLTVTSQNAYISQIEITTKQAATAQTVTVSPAGGNICSGGSATIGLSGSQSGVSYQLYKGESTVGDPVAGTGSALTLTDTITVTGTYTVKSVENSSYAAATMTGSVTVSLVAATSITTQPSAPVEASVGVACDISGLVAAGANFEYQWYTCDEDGNNKVAINTATNSSAATATLTITPASTSAEYYICKVHGYCGDDVYTNVVTIEAIAANTLTYNANGGTGTMSATLGNGSVTLRTNTFTYSGYTFLGWATSDERADAGTVDYADGASYILSADATLHAVWAENHYSFTPSGTNDATVSDGETVSSSTNGTMVFTPIENNASATLTYKTDGLQFGGNSYCLVTVTLNRKMQAGTIITATLKNPDASKARGVKLRTSAGTEKSSFTATTTDVYTKSYTVTADDGLAGSKVFQLLRSENTYLQSLTVVRCAPITYDLTVAVNNGEYGSVDESSVTDIPENTTTSSSSNTFTVNGTTVTATPTTATTEYTYAFSSWSGLPATVTENATVTAIFTRTANSYTLAWNTNGGSDLAGSPTSGTTAFGTTLTKPTEPTKSNYTFAGWNTANDGSGTNYTGAMTMPAANTTYYAKWTQAVTLDANTANHGSGANQSATAVWNATGLTGFVATAAATDYAVIGYFTDATGGTQILNVDGTFAAEDISGYVTDGKWSRTDAAPTLYAHLQQAVQVTYDGNDDDGTGSVPTDATDYKEGDVVTVLGNTGSLAKTDMVFNGWNTAADGTGTFYPVGSTFTMPGEDVTLYAVWNSTTETTYYLGSAKITDGALVKGMSGAAVQFFTYESSFANSTALSISPTPSASAPYSETSTIASWTSESNWTTSSSGNRLISGVEFSSSNTYTLKLGTKFASSIRFVGYANHNNSRKMTIGGVEHETTNNSLFSYEYTKAGEFTGNVTITTTGSYRGALIISTYALSGVYDVTFDANTTADVSGMPEEIVNVPTGSKISEPLAVPTRTGYTFDSWCTDETGTTPFNFSTGTITAATTLYAKWTPIDYNVNYVTPTNGSYTISVADGIAGSATKTANYEQTITLVATPASTSYVFSSWTIKKTSDATDITNDVSLSGQTATATFTMPAYGVTVEATFADAYALTYDANGVTAANMPSTEYHGAGSTTLSATVPTADDCVFLGWNTAADGSDNSHIFIAAGGAFTMPAATETLYAQWGPKVTAPAAAETLGLATGRVATLQVEATTCSGALSYQWYKGEDEIAGATSTQYTIAADEIAEGDSYAYTCRVSTDTYHYTTSPAITVTAVSACGWEVIAGATRTSGAKTVASYEGSMYSSATFNVSNEGKINSDNYVSLTLTSGNYFQNGDTVAVTVTTVSDQGDKGLHIFVGTSTPGTEIGTLAYANTSANAVNKVVLANVPAETSSITIHRSTGTSQQNWYVNAISVSRYSCPGTNEPKAAGNWNDPTVWAAGKVPTVNDRVYIDKELTVNTTAAKAKEVVINRDGATGQLTIAADAALVVAGKIQVEEDGALRPTTPSDLVIESSAAGTGALITGERSTTTQATVGFYTQAIKHDTRGYVNQYIGIPFSGITAYDRFYDTYVYEYIASSNAWSPLTNNGEMSPYTAYNLMRDEDTETTLYSGGTLVLPGTAAEYKDHDLTLTLRNASATTTNMFANPYTAPIDITAMDEDDDFTGVDATIYLFNSGSKLDVTNRAAQAGAGAGQWLVLPVASVAAAPGSYAVKTIPSQQAFMVKGNSGNATHKVTIDYKKHVYDPAMTSGATINPARAPKRVSEEMTLETMNLTVQGLGGASDRVLMFMREDFSIGFDNGWDGRKMKGKTYAPYLYAATDDGKMAVNSIPTAEGTVLGFKAGTEDNYYTFSFEYDGEDNWYLNDLKEQKSTLIHAAETYEFVAEPGDTEARFVISATPIHKITTGNESASAEAAKVRKLIIDDKIYIIRGGRMYSVDGQMIK